MLGLKTSENVLVVEDSIIIALDTEENLKRIGVKSVRIEGSVKGALKAISEHQPDFAIVDYNLGDETSVPVARELARLGVPFVLATGYTEISGQLDSLGAKAFLHKPYGRDDIEALIAPSTAA